MERRPTDSVEIRIAFGLQIWPIFRLKRSLTFYLFQRVISPCISHRSATLEEELCRKLISPNSIKIAFLPNHRLNSERTHFLSLMSFQQSVDGHGLKPGP